MTEEPTPTTQPHTQPEPNPPKRKLALTLYEPAPWQLDVHSSKARYRILVVGRRGGKSFVTNYDNISKVMNEAPAGAAFLFAANVWPETQRSYDNARSALEKIELQAQRALGRISPNSTILDKKRVFYAGEEKSRFRHNFVNGTYIEYKSAQEPDNLRGPGYYQIVLDEFSEMPGDVWDKVLRPTLAEHRGRALISGTPKGKGQTFHKLFQRGNNGKLRNVPMRSIPGISPSTPPPDGTYNAQYQSFHYPTWANPLIDDAEILEMKTGMSDLAFRQEVLAEFLEEGSGVFTNIRACVSGTFEPPQYGEHYVLGWDPARKRDFSAMGVMSRERKKVVWWKIVNGMSWPNQLDLVEREAKRYKAKVVLDSTGLGDPVSQLLQSRGLIVDDIVFKNVNKQQLIENLALMLEHNEVSYPETCAMLVDQLEKFTFTVTAQGRIQYNAPEGEHDDAVSALALCCWGVRTTGSFLFPAPTSSTIMRLSGMGIVGEDTKVEEKKNPQLGWKIGPNGLPFYPQTTDSLYRTPCG